MKTESKVGIFFSILRKKLHDNKSNLISVLIFAVFTFSIELISSFYLVNSVKSSIKFRSFVTDKELGIVLITFSFFLRVFLLHLILGAFIKFFQKYFKIKNSLLFYLSVIFYAYISIALKYPQIFDESEILNHLLKSIRLFEFPWIEFLPISLILLQMLYYGVISTKFSCSHFVKRIGIIVLLIGYFYFNSVFYLSKPSIFSSQSLSTSDKPKNIIVISIDSLLGHAELSDYANLSPALNEFLKSSIKFDRVITPLAQTHASLYALFSSKVPTRSGIRTNLPKQALNTDLFLNNTNIDRLKGLGYQIQFMKDGSEYEYFSEGKIIDKVFAPDYHFQNIFLSNIFRNSLVYGLFNNHFGYAFLPELKNNNAFIFAYDLKEFSTQVNSKISKLNATAQNQFFFIHSCNMHWPGVLPYPYYPQNSFPLHDSIPFSYTTKVKGLSEPTLTVKQWKNQIAFNQKIYRSAAKRMIVEFLNPVFEQINASGLNKNSIIILMSDHGEDLWKAKNKYPIKKLVQHGSSLLFESISEMAFLRIGIPGQESKAIHETVGLVDILPTALNYFNISPWKDIDGKSLKPAIDGQPIESRFYYSETGLWPFVMSKEFYSTSPPRQIGPLFRWDDFSGKVYVDPDFLPGIVQQKQRALYYKDFRYTVYPTKYGYKEFLCDRDNDPDCTKNVLNSRLDLTNKFRTEISKHFKLDQISEILKVGPCSRLQPMLAGFSMPEIRIYQWQYYYQALECINTFHDFHFASKILQTLLQSKSTSEILRPLVQNTLFEICGKTPFYLAANINSLLNCNKTIYNSFNLDFMTIYNVHKKDENFDSKTAPVNIVSHFKSMKSIDIESWMNVVVLGKKYEFNSEKFYHRLDMAFAIESEYHLEDALEPFFFGKLAYTRRKNIYEAIFEVMKDLIKPGDLGLRYFDYALDFLENLPLEGNFKPIRSVRNIERPLVVPFVAFDFKSKETTIALHRAKLFLCRSNQIELCQKASDLYKKYRDRSIDLKM